MSAPPTDEPLRFVILGHVDHGKSTVIGRLLADSGALPDGKIEQVRATCARNAKPFEYAFLLDALKDEQAQGITIDSARCFFRTARRRYMVMDAPGHVEFLKNMITGAARAEAALIVIDAAEGVRENSKRHGYVASMLGIRSLAVVVNKMDLVGYREEAFRAVRDEYAAFLERLRLFPAAFIPANARDGVNVARRGGETPWYDGPTVLEQIDSFERRDERRAAPFRLPLQGVYKFTEADDDRRIFAGTVETGSVSVGDEVVFLPSGKRSRVRSVEAFHAAPRTAAAAGEATGLTLETQVYARPGETLVKASETPARTGTRVRANLFWMGRSPMVRGKRYKLKIGAARTSVTLADVVGVLDAEDLSIDARKKQVDRHDIAEVLLETARPVAFDVVGESEPTARFVIVADYEISGAGVVLEAREEAESVVAAHVREREFAWKSGGVGPAERSTLLGHASKFVVVTGDGAGREEAVALALERALFARRFQAYYLRPADVEHGLDSDLALEGSTEEEHIRRLGELARILTDSGQIFIASLPRADGHDLRILETLNRPHEILVVHVGDDPPDFPVALRLDEAGATDAAVERIVDLLKERNVILEYSI